MKKQSIFAVLAAVIWGAAFVAQKLGANDVSPLTFNAARAVVATVTLALLSAVIMLVNKKKGTAQKTDKKKLIIGGFFCGLFLTLATAFQQASLSKESAGKAGFVTALYIVIVPILGLFLKKRVSVTVWISVIIATIGLYFLCVTNGFTLVKSDIYLLMCALMFSVQILFIDYYVSFVDGVLLSLVQFITMAVLSTAGALIFETVSFAALKPALLPILYLGVFSSGIAYTLQILAQKDSNPTVISLLLSLESVFSVIADAIFLRTLLGSREAIGCVLMLFAILLSQIPRELFSKLRAKIKNT